jgi:site-specific recombinase XerD
MPTLQEAQEQYVEYLQRGVQSPRTLGAYQSDLSIFTHYFRPDFPIEKLSLALVGRFMKSGHFLEVPRTQKARAIVSQQRIIRVVRQFLIWVYHQGLIESVPLPKAISWGRSVSARGD